MLKTRRKHRQRSRAAVPESDPHPLDHPLRMPYLRKQLRDRGRVLLHNNVKIHQGQREREYQRCLNRLTAIQNFSEPLRTFSGIIHDFAYLVAS